MGFPSKFLSFGGELLFEKQQRHQWLPIGRPYFGQGLLCSAGLATCCRLRYRSLRAGAGYAVALLRLGEVHQVLEGLFHCSYQSFIHLLLEAPFGSSV